MANTGYPDTDPYDLLRDFSIQKTALLSLDGLAPHFPRCLLWPKLQKKYMDSFTALSPSVDVLGGANAVGNSVVTAVSQTDTTLLNPSPSLLMTSYAAGVELSAYAEKLMSGDLPQLPYQLAFKKLAIIKQFLNDLFRNQVGASIKGIPDFITAGQTLGAAPAALNLDILDDLVELVQGVGAEATEMLMVMHPNTLKTVRRLFRGPGGGALPSVMINGNRYPMWSEIPIVKSYYVPLNEGAGSNETSIYLIANGYENNGFYLACPSAVGSDGWTTELVHPGTTTDTYIYRIRWFVQTFLQSVTGAAAYRKIV